MRVVKGIGEILEGFAHTQENVERDAWQIAKKIQDSWAFMIHLTDAIDKGDYLRAVRWHPQETGDDMQQFTVDTSDNPKVDYPGFVEGGTKYMAGRFPASRAVEREDFVQTMAAWVENGFSNAR